MDETTDKNKILFKTDQYIKACIIITMKFKFFVSRGSIPFYREL
jgi:hypothetical protein